MILQAVVQDLAPDAALTPPQRVQRQREAARRALAHSARLSGAPHDIDWPQDANRVPQPVGPWRWSISHKPGCVAAVVARSAVGIDIEELRPRQHRGLLDRLADNREWDIVGERSWKAFFRVWTAKEATLKANGRGIGGFADCRVVALPADLETRLALGGCEWTVDHWILGSRIAAVTRSGDGIVWHGPDGLLQDPT